MVVNQRGRCACCGNERRKPRPLGLVAGLPSDTAKLLVCRACREDILARCAATRDIRVRLLLAVEDAALLEGADPA